MQNTLNNLQPINTEPTALLLCFLSRLSSIYILFSKSCIYRYNNILDVCLGRFYIHFFYYQMQCLTDIQTKQVQPETYIVSSVSFLVSLKFLNFKLRGGNIINFIRQLLDYSAFFRAY